MAPYILSGRYFYHLQLEEEFDGKNDYERYTLPTHGIAKKKCHEEGEGDEEEENNNNTNELLRQLQHHGGQTRGGGKMRESFDSVQWLLS